MQLKPVSFVIYSYVTNIPCNVQHSFLDTHLLFQILYPIFPRMSSSLKDQFCLQLRIWLILNSLNCIAVFYWPRIIPDFDVQKYGQVSQYETLLLIKRNQKEMSYMANGKFPIAMAKMVCREISCPVIILEMSCLENVMPKM